MVAGRSRGVGDGVVELERGGGGPSVRLPVRGTAVFPDDRFSFRVTVRVARRGSSLPLRTITPSRPPTRARFLPFPEGFEFGAQSSLERTTDCRPPSHQPASMAGCWRLQDGGVY